MLQVLEFYRLGILLLTLIVFNSCGSVKIEEMRMLEEVGNELETLEQFKPLKVQTDDILGIQVTSRNPETVLAFQVRQMANTQGAAGEQAIGGVEGYRVDEEGNIYLPFVDQVKASGKTLLEIRQEITERLSRFIPDASVQVRFLSFRVTVLGEVNRPNTYIIPNEKVTILEAIGMAGDFTPYALRNTVLVIRERQQLREFARIDTQEKNLFESPYFYLSPNDIVYVEPHKAKQYATRGDFFDRYGIPVITILTSVAIAAFLRN